MNLMDVLIHSLIPRESDAMSTHNDFETVFITDKRNDDLMVEVLYKDQILFQLNKFHGTDNVEIVFLSDLKLLAELVEMRMSLSDFEDALANAKRDLLGA